MSKAKYKLQIYMIVAGMPFDGDTLKERSLGGSETAGICVARELARRGHDVNVFSNLPHGEKNIDGVGYLDINRASEIITKSPHDVLIVQRDPRWFGHNTASKINVLWNHDLAVPQMIAGHRASMWNIDKVFLLSPYHIEQTKSVYSFIKDEIIWETRNGIDLGDNWPGCKNVNKMIYGARPERGLETLVKPGGIMEKLYEVNPLIKLHVCSYDNVVPEMRNYYNYLWQRCEQLPNVINLGSLKKKELYNHYAESYLYLYPTEFLEISCITAMECMASGTPMVTSRLGALPDTLGEGTSVMLDGRATSTEYQDRFIGEVLDLMNNVARWEALHDKCLDRAYEFTWEEVARDWEKYFYGYFDEHTADKKKLIRHFLYNDDVMTGQHLAEKYSFDDLRPKIYEEYGWLYEADKYQEKYNEMSDSQYKSIEPDQFISAHKNHFITGGGLGVRWPQVKQWFDERGEGVKDARVLDYGCDVGHFTCAIAPMVKEVVGTDLSERSLKIASHMIRGMGIKNASVINGLDNVKGEFDIIFLGDVLEHVEDPIALLNDLRQRLRTRGFFLITTPYGPTRFASGRKKGHKNHVHHFEFRDLHDMFGSQDDFACELIYWTVTQYTGEVLGWYMTSFRPSEKEYGEIDLKRKELIQRPRQELSVCMIAKNEEAVIRRSLNSVSEIADEIIVVDTGSTDSTVDIVHSYGDKDCPVTVIHGSDPIKYGFETPRNESISEARSDWILWLDADEELQGVEKLRKYLRPSIYDGFRIKQHHFSCQPANMTVIDKPVRLFRRSDDIQFYGLVHEHPEKELNEGVGEVVEISDVDLAHGGYYTETQRRAKFWRNINLMMRDIERYPERILSKFLYMRDLNHLVAWSFEERGRIEQDAILKCVEIVHIYRNNFLSMGGHMMVDGLQYYSRALTFMGKGIEYTWGVDVNSNGVAPQMMKGKFESKDDFLVYISRLLDEKVGAVTML